MKKVLLSKIKSALIAEKELIIKKHSQTVDIDADGDEIDLLSANVIMNTEKQLMLRDQARLSNIEVALVKISEGSYGACEDCAETINIERLKINPTYKFCILCAEKLEREEKARRLSRY